MKVNQGVQILTEQREGQENISAAAIVKALSAMGITIGAGGALSALGGMKLLFIPVLAAVVSVVVIFGITLAAKGRSYGSLLCLLMAAAQFFLSVGSIVRCAFVWMEHFRRIWNREFGTFYEGAFTSGCTETDVLMTETVMVQMIALLVCELVRRRSFILLTVTTFLPLCMNLMLNAGLPAWETAAAAAGWITAWCGISGPSKVRWEAAVMPVFMLAVLCTAANIKSASGWQNASVVFKAGARNRMERLRFGEDTLPQGNLKRADQMLAGTQERLEIKTEGAGPMYLRGFVGSRYVGNEWKSFPAETYGGEFSGMLGWLEEQQVYPGMQYAGYRELSSEENEEGTEKSVSVKNVGANRKYIYLPETVSVFEEEIGSWKQDWYLEAEGFFGRNAYEFTYYDAQGNAETKPPESWVYQDNSGKAEHFLQAEQVYRSFVYDNYLDLEDEQRELMNTVFFNGISAEEADGIYTVTSRIRTVLRIMAVYRERPVCIPSGQEFASWFLGGGKEGNAVYFASAAVLAYRTAGIPARYAEGYVLTKEQLETAKGNTVTLTNKNAHAWAEIYIDGAGWRTIEVTPGFYEEPYQAEVMIAVPNEAVEGTNGETASIPSSEEYEMPDMEEEKAEHSGSREGVMEVLVLLIIALLVFMEIVRLIEILYMGRRYKNMTGKEQMYFLYRRIITMMTLLYKRFNEEQPFILPEGDKAEFDKALFERTVKRMEKVVYGQMEPAQREISAAEALTSELKEVLRKKLKWRQKLKWRYKGIL